MGTEREGVSLTHLDEPLFDGADATKRDLVDYLDAVSGLILPELRGRPLSVIRVRAGQQPFMQKNLPDYAPPWVGSVTLWAESSRREVRYALCDDRRTLLWLANQRAVEYHPTLSLAGDLALNFGTMGLQVQYITGARGSKEQIEGGAKDRKTIGAWVSYFNRMYDGPEIISLGPSIDIGDGFSSKWGTGNGFFNGDYNGRLLLIAECESPSRCSR